MKVYLAADHGGFQLKNKLISFVQSLGYETEDCGAFVMDMQDDYPVFIQEAAKKVARDAANGVERKKLSCAN